MWNDVKGAKGFKKKWFYIFGDPIAIAREKEGKKPPALVVPMHRDEVKVAGR
jgi:hypothetical protein